MKLLEYLIENNEELWEEYTNHKFVKYIYENKLTDKQFKKYLIQDNLFLEKFKKYYKSLLMKSSNKEEKEFAENNLKEMIESEKELNNKINNLNNNIKSKELNNYLNYLEYIDKNTNSFLELIISLCVCVIGYGYLANNFVNYDLNKIKNKEQKEWIKFYLSNKFQDCVLKWESIVNNYKINKNLNIIFKNVCKLEIEFFNQVLN